MLKDLKIEMELGADSFDAERRVSRRQNTVILVWEWQNLRQPIIKSVNKTNGYVRT